MTYLVDTDWVISFLNGRDEAVALIKTFADEGLALSLISYGEIYEGLLHDSHGDQRVAQLDRFLATVDVVTPDAQVARHYARIRSHLRARGTLIPDNDIWIAATAMAHDFTLVSRDLHFSRVPDLRLWEKGGSP